MKMRLLSLFDGTGSLSRPFFETCEVQTLDIDGRFGCTLCCDILKWDYSEEETPDYIWAGVPCEQYSTAHTVGVRHLASADALVAKTWEIINYFLVKNPALEWWVENPDSSLLWKRAVAAPFTHKLRLDFCAYGAGYRKRTKLATNSSFEPRALCNPKTCHACEGGRHRLTAQRGPQRGRTGDSCTLDQLHAYPAEFSKAVFDYCHAQSWEIV